MQRGGALAAFRSDRAQDIALVGALAVDPSQSFSVRRAATAGLAEVHNEHTLRFLYQLLKSPEMSIRSAATFGFTRFVLGISIAPVGGNNDEEFDQIFNPGRRTGARRSAWDNALTRQFAVRSHFRDEADEKARIDFWRSWYEANSAHFPKAP